MQTETIKLSKLREINRAISFAQNFTDKLVYSVKKDATPIAGSTSTAYNRLRTLQSLPLRQVRAKPAAYLVKIDETPFLVTFLARKK